MTTEISKTIGEQLGGFGRLSAMINARNFLDHGDALSFRFSGNRKMSFCKITLDDSDTYTVVLGAIRNFEVREKVSASGIYADQLVDLFERETGLYLSV